MKNARRIYSISGYYKNPNLRNSKANVLEELLPIYLGNLRFKKQFLSFEPSLN